VGNGEDMAKQQITYKTKYDYAEKWPLVFGSAGTLHHFCFWRSGIHAIWEWLRNISHIEKYVLADDVKLPLQSLNRMYIYGKATPSDTEYMHITFNELAVRRVYEHCDSFLSESLHKIMVHIRDPYNWVASRLRMMSKHPGVLLGSVDPKLMSVWCDYAEHLTRMPAGVVRFTFNEWFQSSECRKSVASQLGFVTDGAAEENVRGVSGGSSFDGTRFNKKATQMKVLQRYEEYANDLFYRALFTDRVVGLAKEVFDMERPW